MSLITIYLNNHAQALLLIIFSDWFVIIQSYWNVFKLYKIATAKKYEYVFIIINNKKTIKDSLVYGV